MYFSQATEALEKVLDCMQTGTRGCSQQYLCGGSLAYEHAYCDRLDSRAAGVSTLGQESLGNHQSARLVPFVIAEGRRAVSVVSFLGNGCQ